MQEDRSPGPGAYTLPESIKSKGPTIGTRVLVKEDINTVGPGAYDVKLDQVKRTNMGKTIGARAPENSRQDSTLGPGAYDIQKLGYTPKWR